MPHDNDTNYYAFNDLSSCLTDLEMVAIDQAMLVSRKMQDVMIATKLYSKMPAVAGYLRQSQARVYNVIKHNCYTSVDSFLASRGGLTEGNSQTVVYSLPVSRTANSHVYSLATINASCVDNAIDLGVSYSHYSSSVLTYQSKVLRTPTANKPCTPKRATYYTPLPGSMKFNKMVETGKLRVQVDKKPPLDCII